MAGLCIFGRENEVVGRREPAPVGSLTGPGTSPASSKNFPDGDRPAGHEPNRPRYPSAAKP